MNIEKFLKKHGKNNQKISEIEKKWRISDSVDHFLGITLAPGIAMQDILTGQGLIDFEPSQMLTKAINLSKGGKQTPEEIKNYLIEMLEKGDSSVQGAVSNLQGYAGEMRFKSLSNGSLQLAEDSNQEVVDAMRIIDDELEFIQIKVYDDSNGVIEKIREVNEKIAKENVLWKNSSGEDIPITEPPVFVVNKEIYEDVKNKVSELSLPNKIEDIGYTREEIRNNLLGEFQEIRTEFFECVLSPVVLSTGIQAFFQWYCHRNLNNVLEELPRNLLINSAGTAGALLGRAVGAEIGGAVSGNLILIELESIAFLLPGGTALVGGIALAQFTRGLVGRITERIDIVDRLEGKNRVLEEQLRKMLKTIG